MIRPILALALCLFAAPLARAQLTFGNYPPVNDTNTTADTDNLRWKALSFAIPAAGGVSVDSVTVRLGNYSLATDLPILEIRNHIGSTTLPGTTIIQSFTAPPPVSATIQDYTFTTAGAVTLDPGTSYWLIMRGADAATSFDWRGSSPAIPPVGFATYGGQSLFSTNGGASFSNSVTINSFQMVTVIPEPALGLAAVLAWPLLRRFRRRTV